MLNKCFIRQLDNLRRGSRLFVLLLCIIFMLGSRAEGSKWYDASSPYWFSQSADQNYSHKVYPTDEHEMQVVNYVPYPVTLWNDDAFFYEIGKTYQLLVSFVAYGGQVFAGPDFGGKGGLEIQQIYSNGADIPSDYDWHYVHLIFTVKHEANARPFIRFYNGLGGKVRNISINEITSSDTIPALIAEDVEGLMDVDADLFLLVTQTPLSRITLSPNHLITPGLLNPDIRRTPTPSPERRIP